MFVNIMTHKTPPANPAVSKCGCNRSYLFKAASTLRLKSLENVALFLRLGPPSTRLIRQENGAFLKRSSIRRNLKMELFRKRWRHDSHVITLAEFSTNTNSK